MSRQNRSRQTAPRLTVKGVLLTSTFLAGLLLACGAIIGCGSEPIRPGSYAFAKLEGKLFHDEPFLVVPNRAWRRLQADDSWFFGHSAAFVCHVRRTPDEPIVFALIPANPALSTELAFSWNGEDVSHRSQTRPSGEIQVEIPSAWLEPGTHFLTLHPAAGAASTSTFRFIGYRHLGQPHILEARHFLTYRYLSNLLTFGLTGSFDLELLGGFLFVGPGSHQVDLGTDKGGLLQTRIQNAGAGRAKFHLRWDGGEQIFELTPHERRQIRLEIPPEVSSLELATKGDPNGFFLWGSPHFQPHQAKFRTPIVLVTLDTTRKDALGTYSGVSPGESSTPHLDRLASNATVFDNAYTTAPWTLPAHASIFTGLYPSKHGAGVTGDHLETGFDTLAEILRNHGYLTSGYAGGLLSSSHFGVGQGFGSYRDVDGFETPGDQLTLHAQNFLNQWVSDQTPFFLLVNYFDPHFPYRAPEPFQARMNVAARRQAVVDTTWRQVLDGSSEAFGKVVAGSVKSTPEALAALEAAYRAEVAFTDENLGQLLNTLRQRGLYNQALIVVTADHGELLGEGGYFSHSGRLDGELVEIPLIIKWPGQSDARRDPRLVSLVDLFPTLLQAAGISVDSLSMGDIPLDGIAFGPDSPRREEEPHHFVVAEEHDTDFHRLPASMRTAEHLFAALGPSQRFLHWAGGQSCFRATDGLWAVAECDNADETRKAVALLRELEAQAYRPRVDRIGLSGREREQLRALGYLR